MYPAGVICRVWNLMLRWTPLVSWIWNTIYTSATCNWSSSPTPFTLYVKCLVNAIHTVCYMFTVLWTASLSHLLLWALAALQPGKIWLVFKVIGPILWSHSSPLCHALSLLLSPSSWTSMRRRRATVLACDSSDTWWMARAAAHSGEWAQHFSNVSCLNIHLVRVSFTVCWMHCVVIYV